MRPSVLLAALVLAPALRAEDRCEYRVRAFCFEDDGVFVESAAAKKKPCSGAPAGGFEYIQEVDGWVRLTTRPCVPDGAATGPAAPGRGGGTAAPPLDAKRRKRLVAFMIGGGAADGGGAAGACGAVVASTRTAPSGAGTAPALQGPVAGPAGPGESAPAKRVAASGSWKRASSWRRPSAQTLTGPSAPDK